MRANLFLMTIILVLAISCNDSSKKKSGDDHQVPEDSISIKGVWERTSYYNYQDGKIADSFNSNEANRHIKIFTDSKIMWCRNHDTDSSEWFGYGHYKITDTLLTEILEYGSIKMGQHIEANPEFVFKYTLDKDRYSQIQIDEEGHPLFAENYTRLE